MAKKIIFSGRERASHPFKSFMMSLALTGMGEVYSGYPMRGIIYALLRVMSCLAVPFYSIINPGSSFLTEVFISIIMFLLLTIISPLNCLYVSLKRKKHILTKFNSPGFYSLFIIFSIILTAFSVTLFSASFSIIKIKKQYGPFAEMNDIAVVKKTGNIKYRKGDLIMRKDSPEIVRIIGTPGEKVSYNKGRFSIDNSELDLSIFNDIDLKKFSLTEHNVISESNGYYRYPVIHNPGKLKFTFNLKDNEYFAAPDDRNETEGFQIIKPETILGRVEGIMFSFKRSDFIIKPLQINH